MRRRAVEVITWAGPEEYKLVVEQSANGKKWMRLKNVLFDRLNITTTNGTYYSFELMKPALEKVKDLVQRKMAYFYVDHPEPVSEDVPLLPNSSNQISRAGALLEAFRYVEPKNPDDPVDLYGDFVVLDTTKGREIQACLEAGGAVGFSKRGLYDRWVKTEKGRVPEKYYFEGWDIVVGQSVPEAETASYVFEQTQMEEAVMEIKNLEDLKNQLPAAVFEQIQNDMREQIKSELEDAQTTELTKKVEEQVNEKLDSELKPVKEQITALEQQNQTYQEALETIVTAVVEAGLVDQRETSEVEAELKEKLQAKEQEVKELQQKVQALETAAPAIKGEAVVKKAQEQLSGKDEALVNAVIASMKDSEYSDEESFKRALEQHTRIAESVLSATGKGTAPDPEKERNRAQEQQNQPSDEEREKRRRQRRALAGLEIV